MPLGKEGRNNKDRENPWFRSTPRDNQGTKPFKITLSIKNENKSPHQLLSSDPQVYTENGSLRSCNCCSFHPPFNKFTRWGHLTFNPHFNFEVSLGNLVRTLPRRKDFVIIPFTLVHQISFFATTTIQTKTTLPACLKEVGEIYNYGLGRQKDLSKCDTSWST